MSMSFSVPDNVKGTESGSYFEKEVLRYLKSRFPRLSFESQLRMGENQKGGNRTVDLAAYLDDTLVLVMECKYQGKEGTTDDKVPYAIADLRYIKNTSRTPIGIMLIYAGTGWSNQGAIFNAYPEAFEYAPSSPGAMRILYDEICLRAGLHIELRKNRTQLSLIDD